jgi:hypothetical protein
MTVIGVVADPSDHDVVLEFFELFKTPWEFYRSDRLYDVVLCTADGQFDDTARVTLLYAGRKMHFDNKQGVQTESTPNQMRVLTYRGQRIPIYGDGVTFPAKESSLLANADTQAAAAYLNPSEQCVTARIGYDLFGEVRKLLTVGQPAANASTPTLELHISLLRDLISECGISIVEIPPLPEGYRFIACLTHDVDHPSIRHHKWDHTALGFLCRAVFGSVGKLVRGQMLPRDLVRNWWAALRLPLVYLGVVKDIWSDFADRYIELEEGIRSTFFVIPFKDRPGTRENDPAPKFRAASYGAADIADTIRKLTSAGCEVGLHGIDAWCDISQSRAELAEIRCLTGAPEIGVRMHWLYYNQQSPAILEKAEAAYDSTIGYNETVGYRAGTTQAYKPLGATHMLELPLHVMDTALFYPAYLGLSPLQAKKAIADIVGNATKFGGCITVNWHDRSLAPERLWDAPYRDLLEELKSRDAWFATAREVVSWFQKRRSVVFETSGTRPDEGRAKITAHFGEGLPGLRLRINKGRGSCSAEVDRSGDYLDRAFDERLDRPTPFGVGR